MKGFMFTLVSAVALMSATGTGLAQSPRGGAPGADLLGPGGELPDAPLPRGAGPAGEADDTDVPRGASREQRGLQEGDDGDAGTRRARRDADPGEPDSARRFDDAGERADRSDEAARGERGDRTDREEGPRADTRGDADRGSTDGARGDRSEAGGAVRLSERQRAEIRQSFASHRPRAEPDIDFDVHVGVSVPRHIHLVVVPDEIVEIVPAWRRYLYFVVGDEICIVDPDTYVIVEVIVLA
jgi:hypothetical protein